jgi:glucose-6-phosphate isomerase/transaldolase/glucose-6-phosphate isomerase
VIGTLAKNGRNKLTFVFPPAWAPLGSWLEQLLAESTGKEGRGILPVCAEPLKRSADYNDDRVFVIFSSKDKTNSPKVSAIIAAGHPVISVQLQNKYHLASQMFLWEMATAVAAHILGVNPFDQPDVEASKVITRRMIDLYQGKKELPQEKAVLTTKECYGYGCPAAATPADALAEFFKRAKDSAYVCLQVYLQSTSQLAEALFKFQEAISIKYRLAVIISYGPRYLHSTGQLHKGDAGQGLFIQFTSDDPLDIAIPDRPGHPGSSLTFGTLKSAQAMGDRQALIRLNRKIIRFHLKGNIIATIKTMTMSLLKN